ncbi:hypothetical protein CEXT_501271 [Caerostris extrusa]|uniref:Uncharacterized protein n=1 Tax=Caerostris extrusa TaxID=172846 RepID=A0AAV4RWB8_CAEEX|nr:hypothetical protein CEXT_501271 [Caerostris extrusa]
MGVFVRSPSVRGDHFLQEAEERDNGMQKEEEGRGGKMRNVPIIIRLAPGPPSTDGCGELSWSGSERNRFHLFTRKCSDLFYISLIRRFRTSGEMYERDTVERKINLLSVNTFLMWVGKKCTGTEIRKRNPLRRYSFSYMSF